MNRVISVEVDGLFGYLNHKIAIRSETPTIITAPNGAGKTHILSLLRAGLSLDFKTLLTTSYGEFRVSFLDGRALRVQRAELERGPEVRISALRNDEEVGLPVVVDLSVLDSAQPDIPSWITQRGEDRWFDSRVGRNLSRTYIERRYGSVLKVSQELTARSPEVIALCQRPFPILIDTKRLDVSESTATPAEFDRAVSYPGGAASRISEYTSQLRSEVTEARRGSVQATQSADLSFASRALDAAAASVKESELHDRYDATLMSYETLARNGLAVGEAPMAFPKKTNPTVRRILSVFLEDWEKRLEPLLPLNEKIQTLREILDSKLEPSGKKTAMSARGDLEFRSLNNARLRVTRLSSGEQHLVALFTLLLFSAKRGSLVLIDEPEISLHAAWKHDFLDDITRVAAVSDLQVVMATHSSGIINGRWDLAEELTYDSIPSEEDSISAEEQDELANDEDDDF